ncbi:MAG: histidinol dehydrogenase [Thermoplasmata archaeon]|jgi:histidinol dehydrogenase|nr:histidinol dehydrogenase [Thermoplasmata archaeon]
MLLFELAKMTSSQRESVLKREGVDIDDAVRKARPIVEAVRLQGDRALLKLARKYDGFKGQSLAVPESDIKAARSKVPKELQVALQTARKRIESFHARQVLKPFEFSDPCGVFGQRIVPLKRVGVYVPGGSADYVSTVLMACIPARIADVDEIALCTPGKGGKVPDGILAAAGMCGVSEVYCVGGAHSIAAMAYGTETVPKVQKIVGPGGAIVAAAKLLVRNDCEIDFLAGPSEVLIIADGQADPVLLASDMLAQLEHDPQARAVLVTTSAGMAQEVRVQLESQISKASRREIIAKSAAKGAIFLIAESISAAVGFSNDYAPEHLLIDVRNPEELLDRIDNAGSVFLGSQSSVAFGDYCSGTNHILPTKGVASMRSALSVYDFLKVIPYQSISPEGAGRLAPVVDLLARSEGLPSHADAAALHSRRTKK